jgi:hypothetical protein
LSKSLFRLPRLVSGTPFRLLNLLWTFFLFGFVVFLLFFLLRDSLLSGLLILNRHGAVNYGTYFHESLKLPRLDLPGLVFVPEQLDEEIKHVFGLLGRHGAMEIGSVALHNGVEGELGDS